MLVATAGCGAAAEPAEPADSAAEVECTDAASMTDAPEAAEVESELSEPLREDGPLKEPPTGNYRVERVAVADGCVWNDSQPAREPKTLAVISHFAKKQVIANVPAVFGPGGAAQVRMDLALVPGKQVETRRSVCEAGGFSRFRSTVLEVGARSFVLRVERNYEGIESCPQDHNRRALPQTSCSGVEELHFELEGALCPARCAFKPSFEFGVLAGTCNCGRG